MAATYAFCVLAPAMAFALAGGDHVAHCLTSESGIAAPSHHAGAVHTHADGTTHEHHAPDADHAHAGVPGPAGDHASAAAADGGGVSQSANCCGLFSVVGIFGDSTFALAAASFATLSFPALPDNLDGRGPERIIRPPIA